MLEAEAQLAGIAIFGPMETLRSDRRQPAVVRASLSTIYIYIYTYVTMILSIISSGIIISLLLCVYHHYY